MAALRGPRWGWHQLDSRWAEHLVVQSGVRRGDLVLDVGAGTGALTAPLLDAGARVIAFELHPERASLLRERFSGRGLVVVRADASDLRLPRRPFRVVANPPFGITAALLRRLLSPASALVRADLLLPHYAVQRWASGRGHGSARFHLVAGETLPARAFRPAPPSRVGHLIIRAR